ncbi:MAG: hypothetical protein Q7S39_12835 [Ignavibacteria bacterium]|nr:hypothetical protein [Ignavibacteria bacterium]
MDFLKVIGTVFSVTGIIEGLIFLRKATENLDYAIGASLIVQGIVIGAIFFFFANMLINSEAQTALLKDIRSHFLPHKEDSEINEE